MIPAAPRALPWARGFQPLGLNDHNSDNTTITRSAGRVATVAIPHFLILLAIFFCLSTIAHADDLKDFAAFQKAELAALEDAHAKVLQAHAGDAAVEAYRRRLERVDDLAMALVREFARVKSASLESLVGDDPLGVSALPKPTRKKPAPAPPPKVKPSDEPFMDAAAILDRYEEDFAAALSMPPLEAGDLQTLRMYYEAKVKAAAGFIAERGRPIVAVAPAQSAGIVDLCIVLPLLHVADSDWTAQDVQALPDWMKAAPHLAECERFALRCRRPLTAWQFAAFRARAASQPAEDLLPFLKRSARQADENREYHCAIQCYRTGIAQAKALAQPDEAVSLCLSLCDLLAALEHPQIAAEEVKAAMDENPSSTQFGRACVQRLRFLFEAGQVEGVMKESAAYLADCRCSRQMPQLVYVAWATAGRLNRTQEADRLREQFRASWPKHPLCIDMDFATVSRRLTEGKMDEARRLTEEMEVKFPQSPLVAHLREVRNAYMTKH
jgi:hypothetical protein